MMDAIGRLPIWLAGCGRSFRPFTHRMARVRSPLLFWISSRHHTSQPASSCSMPRAETRWLNCVVEWARHVYGAVSDQDDALIGTENLAWM